MANTVFTRLRSTVHSISKVYKFPTLSENLRTLYSKQSLGLDGFEQQKLRTTANMANIAEKFREKMTEYSGEDTKNMIFTEDLKNMIHLAEDEKDVELVIKMIKRFNQQNKQLRFGNFIFGPVVMRLFHVINRPVEALDSFKSEELQGFFDQLISYQILLDLLYENEQYLQVLETVDIITSRQIEGSLYPRNIVVLAMAACFKLNNKESLNYALNLWKKLNETGHLPLRRAVTFCAALAINQNEPALAMEIISTARNQNYTTVRNIKVAALAEIGRVEDAIPILKSVLSEDLPTNSVHTFNKDVLDRVKKAIATCDSPDVAVEFTRIEEIFQKQGQISEMTLDDQLCVEIQKPPPLQNRRFNQGPRQQWNGPSNNRYDNDNNRRFNFRERPGLSELN